MKNEVSKQEAPVQATLFKDNCPTEILISRERVRINLSVGGVFLLCAAGIVVEELAVEIVKLFSGAR